MIDLYTARTPNTQKIHIMLEETGLDYREIHVDIGKGDQFTPEYLAINPNNKVPTIVDHDPADGGDPFAVFESGAILIYLADKTGRFLATEPRTRSADPAMADVPDGQRRPHARAGAPFPRLRPRQDRLRHRALHQGGGAHLPRPRQAPGRARLPGRRLLDRRHGGVPVDPPARPPGPGARGRTPSSSAGSTRYRRARPSPATWRS